MLGSEPLLVAIFFEDLLKAPRKRKIDRAICFCSRPAPRLSTVQSAAPAPHQLIKSGPAAPPPYRQYEKEVRVYGSSQSPHRAFSALGTRW